MTNYIIIAIPIFVLLMGIEILAMKWHGKSVYRLNDAVNDLSCGVLSQLSGIFIYTGYTFIFLNYAIWEIPVDSWIAWICLFLGVDLCYYWFHRMSHVINVGWAAHIVHHQSEEYNLAVALRQSSFQRLFSWGFYIPLAVIGFDPRMMLTAMAFNTLYQFWIHTRLIDRLGFLEWFLNTPSHHRVHHARNEKYLDKNFAGTLIIWDRLFGTFAKEEEEPVYGITVPLSSWNPIWANFHYVWYLCQQSWNAPTWMDKLRVWWKPPGWNPETGEVDPPPFLDPDNYEKYDPTVPLGLALYAAFHFVLIFLIAVGILHQQYVLSSQALGLASLFVVFSLANTGGLFEKRKWALYLENVRLLMIFAALLMLQEFVAPPLLIVGGVIWVLSLVWLNYYHRELQGVRLEVAPSEVAAS